MKPLSSVPGQFKEVNQQIEDVLTDRDAIRRQAEAEAQRRAEREQQLKAELKALGTAKANQLKRIEKVEARLGQQAAPQRAARPQKARFGRRAETKASRSVREEEQGVARLRAIRSEAELGVQQLTKKEQRLNARINAL